MGPTLIVWDWTNFIASISLAWHFDFIGSDHLTAACVILVSDLIWRINNLLLDIFWYQFAQLTDWVQALTSPTLSVAVTSRQMRRVETKIKPTLINLAISFQLPLKFDYHWTNFIYLWLCQLCNLALQSTAVVIWSSLGTFIKSIQVALPCLHRNKVLWVAPSCALLQSEQTALISAKNIVSSHPPRNAENETESFIWSRDNDRVASRVVFSTLN